MPTLTEVRPGYSLETGAAASVSRMDADRKSKLGIISAYRSPAQQIALFKSRYTTKGPTSIDRVGKMYEGRRWYRWRGATVATPGKSKHEQGTAVDFTGTSSFLWLEAHAAEYGWRRTVPSERWHYEYTPATDRHIPVAPKPVPVPVVPRTNKRIDDMVTFILLCYRMFFNRIPSDEEVAGWAVAADINGWGESALHETLLNHKAERGTVDAYYMKLLGRHPEDETQYTRRADWTVRQVIIDIASSPEAVARARG